MDRPFGMVLLGASAIVELVAVFSIGVYPMRESIIIAVVLLVVPSFVVSYVAGQLGIVCGLILGLMPALFAIAQLPTEVFGLSPVSGAVVLFVGYVLLSALSGAGGAALARSRHAA
jgi:hypothetical protein